MQQADKTGHPAPRADDHPGQLAPALEPSDLRSAEWLQRTVGNAGLARRAAPRVAEPVRTNPARSNAVQQLFQQSFQHIVQRVFAGELANVNVDSVMDQLRGTNPKLPARWKFEELLKPSKGPYSTLKEVADALGLNPPEAGVTTTPSDTATQPQTNQAAIKQPAKRTLPPIPQKPSASLIPPTKATVGAEPTRATEKTPVQKPEPKTEPTVAKPEASVPKPQPLARPVKTGTNTKRPVGSIVPTIKPAEPNTTRSTAQPTVEKAGTLTVKTPLSLNNPADKKPVFKGAPDFITVDVDGETFEVKAGQDYLSVEMSALYKADFNDVRGGDVTLRKWTLPGSVSKEIRVVSDGHHRFIWAAHHRQPSPVRLLTQKGPPVNWKDMNYSTDKKFNYPPIDATKEVKERTYFEWVSNEPLFKGKQAAARRTNSRDPLKEFVKLVADYHELKWEESAALPLEQYVKERVAENPVTEYGTVIDGLVASAKDSNLAQQYGKQLKQMKFPQAQPTIVLGPTDTTGNFSTVYNVITLDPVKSPTSDQKLDVLAFETFNAANRNELTNAKQGGGGTKMAQAEFETDKSYLYDALMNVHGITDKNPKTSVEKLVQVLKVPSDFLLEADYGEAEKAGKVLMPDKQILPDQPRRQALWWWKTRNWKESQQREIWVATAHGEGTKSTVEMYKSNK